MTYSKIQKVNLAHSYMLLIGFVIDYLLGMFSVTPWLALLSFGIFIYAFRENLQNRIPLGGWANVVTLVRLSGVFWIAFNYNSIDDFLLGMVAVIIISMDGLDGYLARKQNTSSEFGAHLDMETDAFFVAMMSYLIFLKNEDFLVFLIPGLMRYIYLVSVHTLGLYGKNESLHDYSKWFAVAYFIAVITAFLLPTSISYVLMSVAGLGIIYSFGYSFVKLIKA